MFKKHKVLLRHFHETQAPYIPYQLVALSYFPRHNRKLFRLGNKVITEQMIWEYYTNVAFLMYGFLCGNKVFFYAKPDYTTNFILMRNERATGKHFAINSLEDFFKYNNGINVEWHYVFSEKVNFLFIDFDLHLEGKKAAEPIKTKEFRSLRKLVKQALKLLKDQRTLLFFSGHGGFHLYILLDEELNVDTARERSTEIAKNIIEQVGEQFEGLPLTTKPFHYGVRLDTTTLKRNGSLKAPFSIDRRTGFIKTFVLNIDKDDFLIKFWDVEKLFVQAIEKWGSTSLKDVLDLEDTVPQYYEYVLKKLK